MKTVDHRNALRGIPPVLGLLLVAGGAGSGGIIEREAVALAGPAEPGQAANWGPATLTFVANGNEVWGTTGVGERAERLLGSWVNAQIAL